MFYEDRHGGLEQEEFEQLFDTDLRKCLVSYYLKTIEGINDINYYDEINRVQCIWKEIKTSDKTTYIITDEKLETDAFLGILYNCNECKKIVFVFIIDR